MKEYTCIRNESKTEFIEKKSSFICSIKPVFSEEQALEFVNEISKNYKDATHNVYAYIVYDNITIYKANDDGEPQGTAGIPMLEVMKKYDLINVCAVVTRYFGGILLGAGGLVRAYTNSIRNGIEASKICKMSLCYNLLTNIDYYNFGKVKNLLENNNFSIINILYDEKVNIYIKVIYNRIDFIKNIIINNTNGKCEFKIVDEFIDIVN